MEGSHDERLHDWSQASADFKAMVAKEFALLQSKIGIAHEAAINRSFARGVDLYQGDSPFDRQALIAKLRNDNVRFQSYMLTNTTLIDRLEGTYAISGEVTMSASCGLAPPGLGGDFIQAHKSYGSCDAVAMPTCGVAGSTNPTPCGRVLTGNAVGQRAPRLAGVGALLESSGDHIAYVQDSAKAWHDERPATAQHPTLLTANGTAPEPLSSPTQEVSSFAGLQLRVSTKRSVASNNESLDDVSLQSSLVDWRSTEPLANTLSNGELVTPEKAQAISRLRTCLGLEPAVNGRWRAGTVSTKQLHNALVSVGSTKYSFEEIDTLLLHLSDCNFSQDPAPLARMSWVASRFGVRLSKGVVGRRGSTFSPLQSPGGYVLRWGSRIRTSVIDVAPGFAQFVDALFVSDLQARLGADLVLMVDTVKDLLLFGGVNKMLAELTYVRVDDLASLAIASRPHIAGEALVGGIILANAVIIGWQTSAEASFPVNTSNGPDGWFWIDTVFSVFYVLEIFVRIWKSGSFWNHFVSSGRGWVIVDGMIVLLAVVDACATLAFTSVSNPSLQLFRFVRMARPARLVVASRLKFCNEFTLLIKGLFGGMRTLAWAMVLLTTSIYFIAIFTTANFGGVASYDNGSEMLELFEGQRVTLFGSVPKSMFTLFRCYLNDCISDEGRPLITMLLEAYGIPFAFGYIFTFWLIVFGLFNVITALYIEQTMNAAKSENERVKVKRDMQSIRIAQWTKQLLVKFVYAQHNWNELSYDERRNSRGSGPVDFLESISSGPGYVDADFVITKEVFHIVLQDQAVQGLMDDLGIPPGRIHLFDIFDADRSGDLLVSELVEGLLKIRGEPRKSDVVAALLGIRSMQEKFRDVFGTLSQNPALLDRVSHRLSFEKNS